MAISKAIGASNWLPVFAISLGLRFIVIFFGGNLNSLKSSADLIRSFDSCIALLPKPTILNDGNPLVNVDSTSTLIASKPSILAHFNFFIKTPYSTYTPFRLDTIFSTFVDTK